MHADAMLGIRLSQINAFITAYDCRSFTSASKRLLTSQSTVAKNISSLEKTLGFTLFDRLGNELRPTLAADILNTRWSSIIANVSYAIDEANNVATGGARTVRIGIADELTTPSLDKVIPELNRSNIDVLLLEFTTGELVRKLDAGEIDALITVDYESPALDQMGYTWSELPDSSPLCLVCHIDNPLAQQGSLAAQDLVDCEIVSLNRATYQTYTTLIESFFSTLDFDPNIIFYAPNLRSALATIGRTKRGALLVNQFVNMAENLRMVPINDTRSSLIVACTPENPNGKIVYDKLIALKS